MPAEVASTESLPGLSPVAGKPIVARFDGGLLSSDGGLLALREIEQRLVIAACVAGCIADPRVPEQVIHQLDEIVRFRMLMIAAGYEDGNDADALRHDPMFKLANPGRASPSLRATSSPFMPPGSTTSASNRSILASFSLNARRASVRVNGRPEGPRYEILAYERLLDDQP
jgi:Transposase DDE domain group 1